MPTYGAYKDSGVEWLGEVPAHWLLKKLKHIGVIYAGLAGKKGEDFSKQPRDGFSPFVPFTSIANNTAEVKNIYQYVFVRKHEEQSFVKKNDLLFLMSSETLDDIAKCSLYLGDNNPLYLNSFCKGFRITSEKSIPKYINYLLQSDNYRHYFGVVARGFTRINLKQEFINGAPILLPPAPEQTAIAAFLDRKTAQIDQAVAIKEQQIALLKEHKQILIQTAVTRGLDPNVPMRDSGVKWIGEIPAHWEIRRSKFVFTQRKELAKPGDVQLSATQAYGVIPQDEYESKIERRVVKIQFHLEKRKHVEIDDFVISMRSFQGGLERAWSEGCIRSSYVVLRPLIKLNASYYGYLFKSSRYISALQSTANFIRDGQDLNFENFSMIDLPIAPLEEQCKIADYLDNQIFLLNKSTELLLQQIDKLKEYKTTLINSAVTGKIRVAESVQCGAEL
ncbi:MAG: restriction endonuclease subunit S [Methylococcaceae bacterium]|nr:restriction endonuclease subunit S [Methylococcaceae bacterium]